MDIQKANEKALEIILNAQPVLIGMGIAKKELKGMHDKLFLHAGPPVTWERMSGPLKGAIIGGLIYEGLAKNEKDAQKMAANGEIEFAPCHHYDAVGPMAGVITPSMPVWIIENKTYKNKAYCTLNEGLGKVLRYGAFSKEVIDRLKWMEKILYPVLKEAIKIRGEYDLKTAIAEALQMGDECHNRNRAGTSLFIRAFAPAIIESSFSKKDQIDVINFINSNDHFFLNLSMPAGKATVKPAENIEGSSVLTIMARNGTDFGIQVSGLPGQWFVGQAEKVDGLYFPGYTVKDASRDIGDSVITETSGFGGFAMAAAPAIVKFVGGTPSLARDTTLQMYEITVDENNVYKIPNLNFRGTPTGIDLLKIIELDILPAINTGIAHKDPGVGQIGAGLVKPPKSCFTKALETFVEKYQN